MSSFSFWHFSQIHSEAIERAGYEVLVSEQNKGFGIVVHAASGRIFEILNKDLEEIDSYQVLNLIKEWSKR